MHIKIRVQGLMETRKLRFGTFNFESVRHSYIHIRVIKQAGRVNAITDKKFLITVWISSKRAKEVAKSRQR